MKIGILGCRGIPNNHGGFEQFAQHLSVYLTEQGHDVFVYNSHNHPYTRSTYNGVNIIKCFDPEYKVGTLGQFIYDLNCIKDSHSRNFDILLQLGYTSNSVWKTLLPKKAIVITNMDGLEWKRTKYSKSVRQFLKMAEKWAVNSSDYLISDSKGIQQYLLDKYGASSSYIPYGAEIFENPDSQKLKDYQLKAHEYSILVARIEPENNIETIIKGYIASESAKSQPLIIVGDCSSNFFGKNLLRKYQNHSNLRFLGALYDIDDLNNLRYYSRFYFHGHSVGGTNPSLLEAMASQAFIIAHENPFNKAILGNHGCYFSSRDDIKRHLDSKIVSKDHPFLGENKNKIERHFNWDYINSQYLSLFNKAMERTVESV